MGSKNRIAKEMLPIILKDRKADQYYVEPFVGGCNMIDKVGGGRIGNDVNPYLIAMWKALVYDGCKPFKVNKDEYTDIRINREFYADWEVGWVGFNCSYCGKFFAGYAGEYRNTRNYQDEAIGNVTKQIPNLIGVDFYNLDYWELEIPPNSIIYCDPPYENTAGYKVQFDHAKFWQWVRDKTLEGHKVFVSEYNAPFDFVEVWSKELKSQLSANGKAGGDKASIEKLFIYEELLS